MAIEFLFTFTTPATGSSLLKTRTVTKHAIQIISSVTGDDLLKINKSSKVIALLETTFRSLYNTVLLNS